MTLILRLRLIGRGSESIIRDFPTLRAGPAYTGFPFLVIEKGGIAVPRNGFSFGKLLLPRFNVDCPMSQDVGTLYLAG